MTDSNPTLLGLLAACKANPEDDTPRLIFADWLEENGEPERAEFIRLQIEAASLPEYDPRACDLDIRAEAILAQHETTWLGDWSELLVRWTFHRGFLDAVTIEAGLFIRHGEELFRQFSVRKLRFVGPEGHPAFLGEGEDLLASSASRCIRSFDCSDATINYWLALDPPGAELRELILRSEFSALTYTELSRLCSAANLKGLEVLDIGTGYGPGLGDLAVELLAESVFAPCLRSLALDGHHIGDAGAIRLASDPRFGQLERLRLAECGEMTADGLRALLHSPTLPRQRDLCLSGNIDPRIIANAPLASQLERLDLWPTRQRTTYSPAAWDTFGRSPRLQRLAHLGLANGILGPYGAAFLSAEGSLPSLRSLSVWNDPESGDAIIAALADRPEPPRLTSLELIRSGVTVRGIHTLASSPVLSGLRKLRISWDLLPRDSLEELLGSSYLSRRLTWLDLAGWVSGGGFQLLACCPRLASLTHLNLTNCGLDAEGMAAMLASPFLRRLTALHLGSERSSEALHLLATSSGLPRLREVVIGSGADMDALNALRQRFGARLIVYPEQ